MSKVTNYLMVITGLVILLTFAGINTGAHWVLEQTGILSAPENITSSPFFLAITASLALTGAATIVIGFFSKTNIKEVLLSTYLIFLVYFVAEFANIIIYINGNYGSGSFIWVSYVVVIIFSVLAIGFLSSIIDFYQGGS
jgi:hypothetical protein